jgi:cytochrome c oxidase cbb3-type subunit 4
MKLVSNYFSQIEGIAIFPIISILIFFTFFLIVGIRAFSIKKNEIEKLSRLPIDDNN